MANALVIVSLFIYLPWIKVECQTAKNIRELWTELFVTRGYNTEIRPRWNQALPTVTSISFHLTNLNEVNEVKGTIKTTGYLHIGWQDEFLMWTPGDYGDAVSVYWSQDVVWKPEVALKNSYQDYKALGDPSLKVELVYDGFIKWLPFRVFESTCTLDITYFPFDIQTCSLVFMTCGYDEEQILVKQGIDGIDTTETEPNSEWDIIATRASEDILQGDPVVNFTLTLQRKSRYVVMNIFLPVLLLTVLDLFVFVLPAESGEKSGYAITVFLAFAVFLTIISGILPETSDTTAIFSIYIVIQAIQSTVITMIALLLVRLNSLEAPVPRSISVILWLVHFGPCRRRMTRVSAAGKAEKDPNRTESEDVETQVVLTPDSVPNCSWKTVTNTLDGTCCVFFFLLALLSTSACMHILSTNQ